MVRLKFNKIEGKLTGYLQKKSVLINIQPLSPTEISEQAENFYKLYSVVVDAHHR